MQIRKSIIALVFIMGAFQANAQITVGLKTGYTRAWEKYDVEVPEDADIHVKGFNIAAMAYLRLNSFLSIGIEPGYVERGAACIPGWNVGIDPGFNGDTELFLKYSELPLMLQGNLPLFKGKLEAFGKAGYGLAYMTAAYERTVDLDGVNPPVRNKIDLSISPRLNRLDHGFHGTLGLEYQLGVGQIFIETAYYSSVRDADRQNFSKNRNLNFNLGYTIGL